MARDSNISDYLDHRENFTSVLDFEVIYVSFTNIAKDSITTIIEKQQRYNNQLHAIRIHSRESRIYATIEPTYGKVCPSREASPKRGEERKSSLPRPRMSSLNGPTRTGIALKPGRRAG